MKNRKLVLLMMASLNIVGKAYTQNCFQFTPPLVELIDNSGYADCIETPTGVYHNNTHHAKNWIAATSIDLAGITPYLPTEFNPYGFQANIVPSAFTVSLVSPSDPNSVALWGKLEYGIALPPAIAAEVNNFVNNLPGTKTNPYLEWELKVTATFYHGSTTIVRDGFYTKDYTTTYPSTLPVPSPGPTYSPTEYTTKLGTWTEIPTAFPFRVRFAPDEVGDWNVQFTVTTPNSSFTSPFYDFKVVDTGKKPPIGIGSDKRYFVQDDKTFIPIGLSLPWPDHYPGWNPLLDIYMAGDGTTYHYELAPPYFHQDFRNMIASAQTQGVNFFRYIMYGPSAEIEFEHLGNYSSRLPIAYEMDKVLDIAEQNDMYIDWNLNLGSCLSKGMYGSDCWDWPTNNGNNPLDVGYCYQRELNLASIQDFFTNIDAIAYYKQRLRYVVARWGYSPHVSIFELMSEIPQIGKDFSIDPTPPSEYELGNQAYINIIATWQSTMADYLKNILHCQQLISPSYSITPNAMDHTYADPNIDIKSVNRYDETNKSVNFNFYRDVVIQDITLVGTGIMKPMVYSEIAPIQVDSCNRIETNRNIWKMLFSGLAMTLDWNQKNHPNNWGIYSKVRQFMQGYNLNGGGWHPGNTQIIPGVPFGLSHNLTWEKEMIRNDLKADLMYLRAGDQNRAIGVLTNRTWNYWTESGKTCKNAPEISAEDNEHYDPPYTDVYEEYNYVPNDPGDNKLKVMGMKAKKYAIYYYDAEQPLLPIGIQIEWGPKLNLEYPDLTSVRPFVLFKLVLLDELNNGGSVNPAYMPNSQGELAMHNIYRDSLPIQKGIAGNHTFQSQRDDQNINIYPNPNNSNFTLALPENYELGNVQITDVTGKIVYSGIIKEKRTELYLNLEKGSYYLRFMNKTTVETLQFVVQ